MKACITLLTYLYAIMTSVCLYAQDPYTEYKEFIKKQSQEYSDFRKKENEEFASFLKNYWKPYAKEAPIDAPTQPEPIQPTIYTGPLLVPDKNPQLKTVPPLKFRIDDKPAIRTPKIKTTPKEDKSHFTLSFYGNTLSLTKIQDTPFRVKGITEKDIANAWLALSETPYQSLINDCLRVRDELQLCDWAYFLLTGKVANFLCENKGQNDITFMHMFLLCQSGYKVKNGRTENTLLLLVSTDSIIYGFPYLTIDNDKYFMINAHNINRQEIYTYEKNFTSSTQSVSMHINKTPFFTSAPFTRTLEAKRYPVKATVTLNKHLIDFYKDYPLSEFTVYANCPVSQEIVSTLLPALSESIKGKAITEAANILLNFVQTAFEYQTDQQQFGYEKPFFVEEVFYYPYSDCEDRSVLYAYLVKELLKLDVVLLNYPNHLATAVRFNENVSGDLISISGQTYTICDPTYINAPIGMAMPQYKQTAPKIIHITGKPQ